jgi:polyhydroxyalkanoate synthesis repressor PhaR
MAKKTVVIKKYENRRLYDTTNSRYVNLDEVAQMLQQGNEVQVLDAASGEDITRLILTQIIVEEAKTPESNFPLELLRQMVVASGRASQTSQESALKYMKEMLDFYQQTYRTMAPPLNPFEFMQNLRPNRNAPKEENTSGSAPVPPQDRQNEAQPEEMKPAESEEVRELKSRLAELERIVTTLVPGSRREGGD